ncbi:MOSC domain-containing protein [Massilia sp. RP-1-19]|uniref:MOSC domain-containing protein n=1 Tax=Massilia polaris TaxID=2728846 RepID=A0A848HSM6_9BURK|nr:MOSC domain-containing protein [Massilia polaris]NML61668.1 MOSC domain-containing protein [Massilia polaris]
MHAPASIEALFIGRARPLARNGESPVLSGIVKSSLEEPVQLSFRGLSGDEQGDTVFHGGPEKAVHQYASEHYEHWRSRYPDSRVPLVPGAFGENLSTTGMTESSVFIGDIYQAGTALLQVSQGRQPCWKLNRHLGRQGAALAMQISGATGWYYRVLKEGRIARHDRLELIQRPCPAWPLERLIGALFPSDLAADNLLDEWLQAATIEQLSANWKTTFARRVQSGRMEDWTRRLDEP